MATFAKAADQNQQRSKVSHILQSGKLENYALCNKNMQFLYLSQWTVYICLYFAVSNVVICTILICSEIKLGRMQMYHIFSVQERDKFAQKHHNDFFWRQFQNFKTKKHCWKSQIIISGPN